MQGMQLAGRHRDLAVDFADVGGVFLHLGGGRVGLSYHLPHILPVQRIRRRVRPGGIGRYRLLRLIEALTKPHRVVRQVGLLRVVLERVDDAVDLVAQLADTLIHRARAIAVDEVDSLVEMLPQLRLADLASDQVEDRCRIRTGDPLHRVRGYREKGPDVAGTIHQARPEEERHPGGQALQFVVALRVGQVGEFRRMLQIALRAIPDLGTLGVLGASREAPLQADGEDFTGGGEVSDRRRQASLTGQLREVGALPDR
ncbi:hypothetical protein D3C77_417580 [compost metagenome]